MREAAARVASRRGSSITIAPPPRQDASSRLSGTRVVLPAPGGATRTALRPSARDLSSAGTASVTGSSGSMLVVRRNLRHMRTKPAIRGLHAARGLDAACAKSDAARAVGLLGPAGCCLGEHAGRQFARHRIAGHGCQFSGAWSGVPRRPAAATCDRMAHLLAEPGRRRHPARAATRPAARRHGGTDRLANAAARARRGADDLFLHRQRAAAGDCHALPGRRHQHQGACELAGLPRHLRAGGGRLPARSSGGERLAVSTGSVVRRFRPTSAAAVSLARGGRQGWDAVRAGLRADPRHRGRRVVHSGYPRHDPRQCRAAPDGLAWRFHAGAATRQGVPAGGWAVGRPVGPRPQRAGDRCDAASHRRHRAAAAADHGSPAPSGIGLPGRTDP